MRNRKTLVAVLLTIALFFSLIHPASIWGASEHTHHPDDDSVMPTIDSSTSGSIMALNALQGQAAPMVVAGYSHSVGLKSDGTVVAMGGNYYGQCNVSDWVDIIQVAAGGEHTVGLKVDGTVVAVGDNSGGKCDVGDWTNIIQIAAGYDQTAGVKVDGTVVAVGYTGFGQNDAIGWTNIIQVAAGFGHILGLGADGTVVAVGYKGYGQSNVTDWRDIVQVAAGSYHTIGLKADGTVVAVGANSEGQCDVGNWKDIIQVAAGYEYTVGLKSDGTAVAVGKNQHGQCRVGEETAVHIVELNEIRLLDPRMPNQGKRRGVKKRLEASIQNEASQVVKGSKAALGDKINVIVLHPLPADKHAGDHAEVSQAEVNPIG